MINMERYLHRRFKDTMRERCHCCGILIETAHGDPLSDYFVMDIQGNFYCTRCDEIFEDEDERIYEED